MKVRREIMAGSHTLALIPTSTSDNTNNNKNGMMSPVKNTIEDEWEINFARFFLFPSSVNAAACDLLVPLPPRLRNRHPRGNWISSPSSAFLRLLRNHHHHLIISVSFNGQILEEHYVSKLHFSWPQVSCTSGFPARGIKTVLVSYRDSVGQIQKFAMRFSSIDQAEAFINTLKEILKDKEEQEAPNTDFGSEISSQSEFMSSNRHSHQAGEELSTMTPFDTYIPKLPPSFNNEEKPYSGTQEKETTAGHNFDGMYPALPPSFASLLMDCSGMNQEQQTVSNEFDLKSQIVKYMEDSSFQDILSKVEKVMSEIGGDMSLSL